VLSPTNGTQPMQATPLLQPTGDLTNNETTIKSTKFVVFPPQTSSNIQEYKHCYYE